MQKSSELCEHTCYQHCLGHRVRYGVNTVGDSRQVAQDRAAGFGVKINIEKKLFKFVGDISRINSLGVE